MFKKLSDYVIKEDLSSNPLHTVKDIKSTYNTSTSELFRAITVAIESECDAIRVYEDLKELAKNSENWISEPAINVIDDILTEEKKHLAQLYKLLKKSDNKGKIDYLEGEQEGEKQINLSSKNEGNI